MSFIKEFWLPDAEILNLKEFKTLDVLSKLEVRIKSLKLDLLFNMVKLNPSSLVCILNNNNLVFLIEALLFCTAMVKKHFLGIMVEQKL